MQIDMQNIWASQVVLVVKNLPANTGDVRDVDLIPELGSLNLIPEMAIHSSMLGWKIPWTERSLAGYSPWGHKDSDMTEVTQHAYTCRIYTMQQTALERSKQLAIRQNKYPVEWKKLQTEQDLEHNTMYVSQKHIIKTINKIKLHCSQRHYFKYIRGAAVNGREMGVGVGGQGGKKKKSNMKILTKTDRCRVSQMRRISVHP